MRTPWIWSVSLGRWWNVHVRLHMLFFLFVAIVIYTTNVNNEPNWLGVTGSLILLVSVILHEIGHVVVARRLGGIADDLVVGPLGGLNSVRVPYEPHSELVAIMAGTLVNAVVCFICAMLLVILRPNSSLIALFQPSLTIPELGTELTAISVLTLVFWTNWSLILVNLIPAFPFDGGRALHAILAFLWPEFDAGQSLTTICRLGKIISALLLLVACVQPTAFKSADPSTWFALGLLSIYIFFNSRREELQQAEMEHEEDTVFGYDFSQGYTSLERGLDGEDDDDEREQVAPEPQKGILGRWIEKRRESQLQREIEQEVEDEKRVDEVLARLHEHGMRSLSPDDRALLDRVSERYRSRQD